MDQLEEHKNIHKAAISAIYTQDSFACALCIYHVIQVRTPYIWIREELRENVSYKINSHQEYNQY